MSRFANKLCPVCKAPFTEGADIVVCPECGTPHHRVCYMTKGKCALEEYHAQGFVWEGRLPDEPAPEKKPAPPPDPHHAEYPQGVPKTADARNAVKLEMNAQEAEAFAAMLAGFNDEKRGADGVCMRELTTYTTTSVIHYAHAFMSFRNPSHRTVFSLNVSSAIFAPLFQFYRKMDVIGVVVMLIMVALSLPAYLAAAGFFTAEQIAQYYISEICSVCNVLNLALLLSLCLFSDYLYYRHCVKKIKKLREKWDGELNEDYYFYLERAGRPSWLRAIVGGLLTALCAACAIVFPMLAVQG